VNRVPADAFQQYLALGPGRSYAELARRLGVAKRTLCRLAARDSWQERLAKIEAEARERADEDATNDLAAVNARHLKMLRLVQGKALQGLALLPLTTGMECVRALDLAIRQERAVLVPPGETASAQSARERAAELQEFLEAAMKTVPPPPVE
jgi:hypothetical protein